MVVVFLNPHLEELPANLPHKAPEVYHVRVEPKTKNAAIHKIKNDHYSQFDCYVFKSFTEDEYIKIASESLVSKYKDIQ